MYKIELPIYYTQTFKTKKDKKILVGMNFYRNAHYYLQNNLKTHYSNLVKEAIGDYIEEPLEEYRLKIKLFYKTPTCDLGNVCSVIDKFVQDAIQGLGLVKNDNVKFNKKISYEVGGQDKKNPRAEIVIEGI